MKTINRTHPGRGLRGKTLAGLLALTLVASACSGGGEVTAPPATADPGMTYYGETVPEPPPATAVAPVETTTTTTTTTAAVPVETATTAAPPATEATETGVAASASSVAACMAALNEAEGIDEMGEDFPSVYIPEVREAYLNLLGNCSAEDFVQVGEIMGEPIDAGMAEFVIFVYCAQLTEGGYEEEVANISACDADEASIVTTVPVVDVVTTSDHCGQPAVGEPITGSGNDVRKVSFAEPGPYVAEVTAGGEGHIGIWLAGITGTLEWGDELLANTIVEGEYDGGKVSFDVGKGGDFRVTVTAEPGTNWEIRFSEF